MSLSEKAQQTLEGIAKIREALLFFIFGLAVVMVAVALSLAVLTTLSPRTVVEKYSWGTTSAPIWADKDVRWGSITVREDGIWSAIWNRMEGVLAAVTVIGSLAVGAVMVLVGAIRYRRGFEVLSKVDPRRYGIGRTGALLVLIGAVFVLAVITWPIGALVLWLGLVLSGIALIRLGEEHDNSLTIVSSALMMVLPISWLGAILLYFGLGEVAEGIRSAAGQRTPA